MHKIIRITEKPLELIEFFGRVCTDTVDRCGIDTEGFIRNLIKNGHNSVLEHANLSVYFTDVSRGFTHELVRHRHSSFSQQSTRYTLKKKGVKLKYRYEGVYQKEFFEEAEKKCQEIIRKGIELGIKNDLLRQALPVGLDTATIGMTANFAEWRHIFKVRTDKAAHWEIKQEMKRLLKSIKEIVPVIFDDL